MAARAGRFIRSCIFVRRVSATEGRGCAVSWPLLSGLSLRYNRAALFDPILLLVNRLSVDKQLVGQAGPLARQ